MTQEDLEFEPLYKEFYPRIHRYLTRLIGVKDAEDLTQEVFVKISRALPAFKHEAQLSTWIYKIATHVAIDRTRSRSFQQETTQECGLVEADPAAMTGQTGCSAKHPRSVEDQVVLEEMNECIRQYVVALPENYRTVVILSEMEGLKDSEIASMLELSLNTVKIRLHRAREKLKAVLTENCSFYRTECNVLACEPKGPPGCGR
jgi:RNA polymerase sigma-70 factor, ECF subfamily